MAGQGLLRVWIRITLVWWLGTFIFWACSDIRIGETWAHLDAPVTVGAGNAATIALGVLRKYSLPHVLVVALCIAIGAGAVLAWYLSVARKRKQRVRPDAKWRSITTSMGDLEKPRWVVTNLPPAEMVVTGDMATRVADMSDVQRKVLTEILSFLAQHPDAFVGDGHHGTLLEHTIHVIERLPPRARDPLLPLVAAAHDAGKVLAWSRGKKGEWKRSGWHDDLGGLLLSGMPSAHLLPESELRMSILAVRYAHKPEKTPLLPDQQDRIRLDAIQAAVTAADHQATAAEKKQVLAKVDRAGLLERAFLESLSEMQFQVAGIKKGQQAAAWRKRNRVYISEIRFRQVINDTMKAINADAAAAWAARRQPGEVAQQTWDALAMLRTKGWLVEEIDGIEAYPPLWQITSGKITLNGIIVVDLPDELTSRLPRDAPYEIIDTKAHFPATALNLNFPLARRPGADRRKPPAVVQKSSAPADSRQAEPAAATAAVTQAPEAQPATPAITAALVTQGEMDEDEIQPVSSIDEHQQSLDLPSAPEVVVAEHPGSGEAPAPSSDSDSSGHGSASIEATPAKDSEQQKAEIKKMRILYGYGTAVGGGSPARPTRKGQKNK